MDSFPLASHCLVFCDTEHYQLIYFIHVALGHDCWSKTLLPVIEVNLQRVMGYCCLPGPSPATTKARQRVFGNECPGSLMSAVQLSAKSEAFGSHSLPLAESRKFHCLT